VNLHGVSIRALGNKNLGEKLSSLIGEYLKKVKKENGQ
jgi:hypothetical protein